MYQRYLTAASFPFQTAEGPSIEPVQSNDITLNALVQNGAQKVDCDRAFLSFIDSRRHFVCSEMTKTQPLDSQDPAQPLLVGTAKLDLEYGVCPYTMSIFQGKPANVPDSPHIIATPSHVYISDFRLISMFATRHYVTGYPNMVSYLELPLRSLSGHILGSYCIVDNKPRNFLDPAVLDKVNQTVAAISSYLDMKRIQGSRERAERMVDGLRHFVGSERRQQCIRSGSSEHSQPPVSSPFHLDVFDQSPTAPLIDKGKRTTEIEKLDLPTRIETLFKDAASMIGYAMDLDGLSLYDTTAQSTRCRNTRLTSITVDTQAACTSSQDLDPVAELLSAYHDAESAQPHPIRRPTQSLMRRLTKMYPQGHVFAVDEHGVLDYGHESGFIPNSTSTSNEWDSLFALLPGARYVIFLPLWHYQREACFATCLAWVNTTGKTLDHNDVNSLTAFGNSLMAEIFRLEALTNTQSKSDFISSISHELRSPLHGILAIVELLQNNLIDPEPKSMVDMIESCSSTLMDTFDHLLKFSKINSHANNVRHVDRRTAEDVSKTRVAEAFVDLRALLEDVVETVSLGHSSALHLQSGLEKERLHTDHTGSAKAITSPVILTTFVENGQNWQLPIDKGA